MGVTNQLECHLQSPRIPLLATAEPRETSVRSRLGPPRAAASPARSGAVPDPPEALSLPRQHHRPPASARLLCTAAYGLRSCPESRLRKPPGGEKKANNTEASLEVPKCTEARSCSRGNSGGTRADLWPGQRQPPHRSLRGSRNAPDRGRPSPAPCLRPLRFAIFPESCHAVLCRAEPSRPGEGPPPRPEQRSCSRLPQPAPPAGLPGAVKFPRGRAEAGGTRLSARPGPALR